MNIAVYLGAYPGNDPKYARLAEETGRMIAGHGDTLVFGGARLGLMNILASAVKEGQGKVIGVMPEFMYAKGRGRNDLDEMIITEDMPTRRKKMLELSDVCIALPGGVGTLEEIAEAVSALRLGLHQSPCVFLNLDGYYEPVRDMFAAMTANGFLKPEEISHVYFAQTLKEAEEIIGKYR